MKNKLTLGITIASLIGNAAMLKVKDNTPIEKREIKIVNKKELVDKALIDAMITVESNGNSNAYNKYTGAIGLMQLTPVIYKNLCGMTKEQAFNPEMNVACGELFMKHLLTKYKGNVEKALLHYNNGHKITNKNYSKKVLMVKK